MGIEDEDLGEKSSASKVASAQQDLALAKEKRDVLAEEGATKAEIAAYDREITKLASEQRQALQDMALEVERRLAAEVEEAQILFDLGEISQGILNTKRELLRNAKEANDEEQKAIILAEKKQAILDRQLDFADGFVKRWTGLQEGPGDTLVGNMLHDPEGTIGAVATSFENLSSPLNITTMLFTKVVEGSLHLAKAQDQAVVNFRKATGASGEFDNNIINLERSLYTAGVSTDEAGQAVQSLFLNVSDFTEMSEDQQEVLAETTAILNELGIEAETTAKNIQFSTKVLGQNVDEAAALQRELQTFAQELGVSADKIAGDFQKFGPEIAALGDKGVDAFRQLEVQAKNTGLQMEELLGITKQFDTFDGAAQSVGKLNALLGGPYLNTLEMVNATNPAERFELLKDSVDKAGKSFEDMEYYERKALAAAVGLNEEQLALMMNSDLNMIKEPAKTAAEMEALRQQTAQFNTIMEELSQFAKGLVVSLGPVIGAFKWFIQILQALTPILEGIAYATLPFLTVGLGLLAAAVLIVTAPIWIILGPLYMLAELIHPGGGPLILGMAAITAAMYFFATALGVATFGILPLIGLVVTLATYLWHKVASPGMIEMLGIFAAAVFLLPPAFLAFGTAILILLPFLPILGIAIWLIMGRLRKLSEILPPLAVGFSMIGAVIKDVFTESMVEAVRNLAIEIANIVESINELDETKAIVFAATTAVTAGAGIAAGAASAALGSIGLGTPAGGGAGGAGGATGEGPTINISLNIDGTEFATAVNNVEVSKYNSEGQSDMYKSVVQMISAGITKGA